MYWSVCVCVCVRVCVCVCVIKKKASGHTEHHEMCRKFIFSCFSSHFSTHQYTRCGPGVMRCVMRGGKNVYHTAPMIRLTLSVETVNRAERLLRRLETRRWPVLIDFW